MNRKEIKEVVKELEETIIPHSILEDLLKHIIAETPHYQNKPDEERLNEAIEALWGDRVKRSRGKGRPKERSDLYYIGKIYDQLRSNPDADINNLAWDMADEALGRNYESSSAENFKNRLIDKLNKSPEAEQADQFATPEELAFEINKRLAKLRMRDLALVTIWLEQWIDLGFSSKKENK